MRRALVLVVLSAGLLALGVPPLEAQMRSATGSYVGDGVTDGLAISVGFAPDVVIVRGDTGAEAVARTSTMVGDVSKPLGNAASAADLIQTFTAGGFTVGLNASVNSAGVTYYWTALKAAAGELEVGTYTGDGVTDPRLVPVAFQPDWVLVMGLGPGRRAVHRGSAMTGDLTIYLTGSGSVTNHIQALVPGGFELGTGGDVNAVATTYHYLAVKKTPGRFNTGIYQGDANDNRNVTGIGFQPNYVLVKTTTSPQAGVARPRDLPGDQSLFFNISATAPNLIQALLPDGFQIGLGANINSGPTHFYLWAAFGGTVNYRSIGTAPDYTTGTVEGTPGSPVVTGTGTAWMSSNRGRGDRILIDGTNYTILAVDSQTQLRLTTAYVGTPGPGKAHTISRQYATLQAWENCVSFAVACSYGFTVASASLVSDQRSEVGIAYDDAVGADFAGGLVIDGAVTSAGHSITLTADGGNRHYGIRGRGVTIDNGASALPAVQVFDDFVTVEWLQITGGGGTADGVRVNLLSAGTGSLVTVRNNLIRDIPGDGVALYDPDGRVDVINNFVHTCQSAACSGVWLNSGSLAVGSRFRLLNNTVYACASGIAKNPGASAATLLLRNNVVFGSTSFPDYDPDPADSVDPASSHNLSEDPTAAAASPAGGSQVGVTLAQIAFFSTAVGSENLHIRSTSVAREQGVDLSTIFADDVDGVARPGGPLWDKGADEAAPRTNYRSIGTAGPYAAGSVTVVPGSDVVNGNATFWVTNNRGQGDRILIQGTNYTILTVTAENVLRLTEPYAGPGGTWGYTIARQFGTLQEWEDCISFTTVCAFFPVASASLVNDHRSEVGVAYKDSVFAHSTGGPGGAPLAAGQAVLTIDGPGGNTDATHTITLTALGVNRHHGLPGTGIVIDNELNIGNGAVFLFDDHVTVEWLEIKGGSGATAHGVLVGSPGPANQFNVRYNLIHDVSGNGVNSSVSGAVNLLLANNIIHATGGYGVYLDPVISWTGQIQVLNNTVANTAGGNLACYKGVGGVGHNGSNILLANNVGYFLAGAANDFDFPDVDPADGWADVNIASRRNLSSDSSANSHNRTVGGPPSGGTVNYTNYPAGNLHYNSPSDPIDGGADLSSLIPPFDIDGQLRPAGGAWDMGADEYGGTTAVTLQSLVALPGDASVMLQWRTASELSNLGFHLYRSLSESGPWLRLTSALIPGLGSSPVGRAYSFRDAGLANGTRYHYRLEDVDASSNATSHGPVSAVPSAAAAATDENDSRQGRGKKAEATASSCPSWVLAAYASSVGVDAAAASLRCTRHGDPDATSLAVLSRDTRQATLELRTGGFYALHEASGSVRVFVPGFDFPQDQKAAALPLRRALVDAVVGRRVQLGGVRALEPASFRLQPSALGKAEMQAGLDGTVRAGRGGPRTQPRQFPKSELATLLPSLFQGEAKKAVVEIAPLRFDAQRQQLVLAKRVRVRLLFTGRETGENGRGSLGRAPGSRKAVVSGEILARLYTTSRRLHSVAFEQLFPGQRRGIAASELRLDRQGQAVGFHLEPAASAFGPGSRLYFYADRTAASTDFSAEVAYELVRAGGGLVMPVQSAAPGANGVLAPSVVTRTFETDRFYQPGLLDAPDPWLWEALASGATRVKPFSLSGVSGSGMAELDVYLQGASESGQAVDHHVSVSVNGTPVGEAQFAGKQPYRMSLSLPASLLREGANELSLTNVADTGVSSLVFLDRFTFAHPQLSSLAGGRFAGEWPESGSVSLSVGDAVSGPVRVVDVTDSASEAGPAASTIGGGTAAEAGTGTASPVWLTGLEATAGAVRFRAEAGRRYWAGSDSALFSPRIVQPEPSGLKSAGNQADYLLIGPRALLAAGEPLVERRQDQGLQARAVAFEEIAAEFGHGQPSAEAIRSFLAYAFHSWQRPSPRYVLLLGDASYDPRNFIGTSQPSPLPALWAKTSYLWTVSDPQLAAVNGDDTLPDLALGRLPAATLEQAEALVQKLLAWEDSGQGLTGAAALVADNPDIAGDFEADIDDIAGSFLGGRPVSTLKLSELGATTRPAILDALNSGLSYINYVGHGGAAVWASENVWNSWDAASLQAQSQQPLLVTMNCLNGYFVAPAFESLSESLLKAEGRGAIASFSPSGLSLDGPAHQYHRALMAELTSGQHARLGDAVLAAQKTYAATGLMPELIGVYHLLGDPATRIR